MKQLLRDIYLFLLRKFLPKSDENYLIIPTSNSSIKNTTIIQPAICADDIDSANPPKLIIIDSKKKL
jgi:hypothetical protein|nr:MAG TPA: hypothetical protein [Caudoviricetes sp.]